ncbi:MAG: hypothetical protein HYU66_07550 [Armatimonadetes bacterium]|nr:hypothetical protein [Armatimonadota bacterium]
MRKLLGLALLALVAGAAGPVWAQGDQAADKPEAKAADEQPAGDGERPAHETARRAERERARERAAAQGNGGEPGQLRQFAAAALSLFGIVLLALAFIAVRVGFSLGCGAVFPGFTERGREWLCRRPWLCWMWGIPPSIVAFVAFCVLTGGPGPAKGLAALVLLACSTLAAVGATCLCEAVGQRLYSLAGRAGSRAAHLAAGSIVLVLLVGPPPGWIGAAFVVPAAFGAFRLGFRDPAEAVPEPLMVFPEPERPAEG